jgi:oligopeptide transport system substrate-binding protein
MNMKTHNGFYFYTTIGIMIACASCTNNPYRPGESSEHTYFGAFSTPPTKMDPSRAYYSHEGGIIDQIYEPPFTYHYLKRPYEVIPLTAEEVPQPTYYDKNGKRIDIADPPADMVGRAEYVVRIKNGIMYQNHPCFAKDENGRPLYTGVDPEDIDGYEYPSDFAHQDTRELKAHDYALQVRRLADPRLSSPILSALSSYILGLDELHESYKSTIETERARRKQAAGIDYMQEEDEKNNPLKLNYMEPDFPGVEVLDDYTYKITLKRKYPQIIYWMCMHFFGPVPHEAVDFYNQPAMLHRQFTLNRCPIGTGPYYLKKFKPNEVIILERNPNYHADFYPEEGAPADREAGMLDDAGKPIPFIQRQVLRLEKEAMPAWNKFLQGYYDASGIANDVFDQAIQMKTGEDPTISLVMEEKGIRLITDIDTMFWYTSLNMLDDVIGGYEEKNRKLRRAISIALDYNEYVDIFANGRGIISQGPIPPGIFGYRPGEEGTNPFICEWDTARDKHVNKPIEEARRLMQEAGYPGGLDSNGEPLSLDFDHSAGGDPFFRSRLEWTRNRLDLIGIRLKDRGTDLSRYRQKREKGNWQVASGGWLADYPDPENFLFLFYGPNGKVKHGGPNATNYEDPEYDRLFEQMESMQSSPARLKIINEMMLILQRDAPAAWQYFPVSYSLVHQWLHNVKPHQMSYNTMKFRRLDPALRQRRQEEWNQPRYEPVILLLVLLVGGTIPAAITAYRRERGL